MPTPETGANSWAKVKELLESDSPDLDQLKDAIKNIPVKNGQLFKWSPVITAAKDHQSSVTDILVQSGFSINCIQTEDSGIYGWCAVGAALDGGNRELAKHLVINLNASPDLVRQGQETLLTAAISRSDFETVAFLLGELRANPDIQVDHNRAKVFPIHLAMWHDFYSRRSDWKMTKLLINHGAKVSSHSAWSFVGDRVLLGAPGPNCFGDATSFGRALAEIKQQEVDKQCLDNLVSLLKNQSIIDDFSRYVKDGKEAKLFDLASLCQKAPFLSSPLVIAAEHNRQDLIYLMVKTFKFKVDSAEERTGFNPLAAAVKAGNKDMVKILIKEMGADVNYKLTLELEPGHMFECNVLAVVIYQASSDPSMMSHLVQLGADVNYEVKVDGFPTSLLHLAICQVQQQRSTALLTQLLAFGASVDLHGWVSLNHGLCQMSPIELVLHHRAGNPKDLTWLTVVEKLNRILFRNESDQLKKLDPEELVFQTKEAALLFEWHRARIKNQSQALAQKAEAAKLHDQQIKDLKAREGFLTPEEMKAKQKKFRLKISKLNSMEVDDTELKLEGSKASQENTPTTAEIKSGLCDICQADFSIDRLLQCRYKQAQYVAHIFCYQCVSRAHCCPLCYPDEEESRFRPDIHQIFTRVDIKVLLKRVQAAQVPPAAPLKDPKDKLSEEDLATLIRNHEAEMELAAEINHLINSLKKIGDPDFAQKFEATGKKLEAALESPARLGEAKLARPTLANKNPTGPTPTASKRFRLD